MNVRCLLLSSSNRCGYLAVLCGLWLASLHSHADAQRVRPLGLVPGDQIALVAPARPISAPRIKQTREHLEALGYRVKVPAGITRRRGYLAGSDEARAKELMDALLDPEVKAVFPMTGGYGTTRILDRLDFDQIRDLSQPKILIGFSDITGLHLAFAAKTNWVTFHSPNPDGMWKSGQPLREYSEHGLWRCIDADQQATGFTFALPPDHRPLATIRAGTGSGELVGGNLTLVNSLMGTPFELQTEGRVVFLEDVHEPPYKVDRYLCQLKLAGKLKAPAAVILGQFTDAKDDDKKEDQDTLTMNDVFADYFANATYPVIGNFPAGHAQNNATLPMGIKVEVTAERTATTVRVLQATVRTPAPRAATE